MEIIVHDTVSAMSALLREPLERRPELLREMVSPLPIPLPGDRVDLHHQGSGFRVDREDARYLPALEWLADRDVLGHMRRELNRASAALSGLKQADTLQVLFVLGNPDEEYLMDQCGGYFGMGGAPGWLYVLAWPTEENIARIAHCAVHELHHNIRYTNVEWNPATVTVGEHVVCEGLAEAFVRELSGPEAMGPWSAGYTEEGYERIMADIDLEGMRHTSAYVLGDTAMRLFGQEPRGIPDMAGYGVGLKLVDAYLARTGLSVVEASAVPAAEIYHTKPDS